MVIGLLSRRTVTLVEPRRLRVEFLNACCKELALHTVQVVQAKAEAVRTATPADVVSARAVAKLDELFRITRSFANTRTAYVLPKGESAENEVAMARRSWHGSFHVKRSVVDERSGIVVATGVSPK